MSTALDTRPTPSAGSPGSAPEASGLDAGTAVKTVVGMELRQRLRSRGWFILLGIFFAIVGVVTLGALGLRALAAGDAQTYADAAAAEASLRMAGQAMFDGVLMITLTLALLVAPALAANAISGDRAGGTLAITQVTLLSTGQLMLGKWIAAWIASAAFAAAALPWLVVAAVVGRVDLLFVLVGLVMILVEFAVITGMGVAVSAITGRTLFAVVVTYLLVAMLSIGTLVAFVLSLQFLTTTVHANQPVHGYETLPQPEDPESMTDADWAEFQAQQERDFPDAHDGIADSCTGPLEPQQVPDGRRVGWLLAPNPFVAVADATPWSAVPAPDSTGSPQAGPLNLMSAVYRQAQKDPRDSVECLDGEVRGVDTYSLPDREGTWPMWPLGLAMQGALTAGLLWWGHRRLDTPAGALATGTRIA